MNFVVAENGRVFSCMVSAIEQLRTEQKQALRLLEYSEPGIRSLLGALACHERFLEPSLCILAVCGRPEDQGAATIPMQNQPNTPRKTFMLQDNACAMYRALTGFFYANCVVPLILPPCEHGSADERITRLLDSILRDFAERCKRMNRIFDAATIEAHDSASFRRVSSREEIEALRQQSEATGETLRFTYSMQRCLANSACRASFYSHTRTMRLLEQYRGAEVATKSRAKQLLGDMLAGLNKIISEKSTSE